MPLVAIAIFPRCYNTLFTPTLLMSRQLNKKPTLFACRHANDVCDPAQKRYTGWGEIDVTCI